MSQPWRPSMTVDFSMPPLMGASAEPDEGEISSAVNIRRFSHKKTQYNLHRRLFVTSNVSMSRVNK